MPPRPLLSPVAPAGPAGPATAELSLGDLGRLPAAQLDRVVRTALSPLRNGRGDPTTELAPGVFRRATWTPDGPGAVELRWGLDTGTLGVTAHGPGASWLLGAAPRMAGLLDEPVRFTDAHPAVLAAQRDHPHLRLGGSGTLYHELLPAIIAQRVTSGEAVRQWRRLCERLGEPAPGPWAHLRLPPRPERLAATPAWWFHPLGIEAARAEPLRAVATHADHLWGWADAGSLVAGHQLTRLRRVGEWTVGVVLAAALGEPDAIAVGDYHLKNVVAVALAGRARGTDEEMVELLERYRPHRGRVVRLLLLAGHRPPAFGPRQRILPMHRW